MSIKIPINLVIRSVSWPKKLDETKSLLPLDPISLLAITLKVLMDNDSLLRIHRFYLN